MNVARLIFDSVLALLGREMPDTPDEIESCWIGLQLQRPDGVRAWLADRNGVLVVEAHPE